MRSLVVVSSAVAMLAVACGGTGQVDRSSVPSEPTVREERSGGSEVILLSGEVAVPGAQAFGAPGFHEPVVVSEVLPEGVPGEPGALVLRLRDVDRPGQTCDREHPLSGCVTVDWSDFDDRPGVPPGGVFDNHVTFGSGSGALALFLTESGALASMPDQYSPG
ncbi:MAG: hypothetical protein ACE5GB_05615 [Acidimicrobiales bacterium]